jgi:GTP-binding protein
MLRGYLLHRPHIVTLFLLIDSKIAPQAIDLSCMRWLGEHHIPFAIMLTKADRKNKTATQKHYRALIDSLEKDWAIMPPMFVVSAHDKLGMEIVLAYIQEITQPKGVIGSV